MLAQALAGPTDQRRRASAMAGRPARSASIFMRTD
jgi:hypothetical protein